jgi:hypothetical protein
VIQIAIVLGSKVCRISIYQISNIFVQFSNQHHLGTFKDHQLQTRSVAIGCHREDIIDEELVRNTRV